jgi:hypothetical protein
MLRRRVDRAPASAPSATPFGKGRIRVLMTRAAGSEDLHGIRECEDLLEVSLASYRTSHVSLYGARGVSLAASREDALPPSMQAGRELTG